MPLIVRFLLWLVCTALTVTAVFFAVGFVLASTSPMPPVAHASPTVFATADDSTAALTGQPTSGTTASSGPSTTPSSVPSPTPRPSVPTVSAPVTAPAVTGASVTPRTTFTSTPVRAVPATPSARSSAPLSCESGAGTHVVRSEGGQATVAFGTGEVCLVGASPAPGFTAQVSQSDPTTLVVTFSSSNHRSVITATVNPQPQASVHESAM